MAKAKNTSRHIMGNVMALFASDDLCFDAGEEGEEESVKPEGDLPALHPENDDQTYSLADWIEKRSVMLRKCGREESFYEEIHGSHFLL